MGVRLFIAPQCSRRACGAYLGDGCMPRLLEVCADSCFRTAVASGKYVALVNSLDSAPWVQD